MLVSNKTIQFIGGLVATSTILAACGGGGSTINNPQGGGTTSPTPMTSPTPTATPALMGTMSVVTGGSYPTETYGAAGAASLDFSCGCTTVAGSAITDSSGNFTLVAVSTPVPTPNPKYTIVPGRNYLVVANPTSGPQAWTIQFAGKIPSRNAYLNVANQSDVRTAAVALYVFEYSPTGTLAYDNWNFNALLTWYNSLPTTAAETKLLDDIVTQSNLRNALWPSAPSWRPGLPAADINTTIRNDLTAINMNTPADPNLPSPCPAECAGTP